MTTPAENPTPAPEATSPAPGAPQEPAAAAPAPKPAPPATSEAPAEPHANVWEDPVAAKAEIERLRRENGAARTTAKAQAAAEARIELAQQIGKAIGLVKDDAPVDPAKLVEQATQSATEARQANVALAVYKAASTAGGDPVALLDSTSFQAKVKDLDPSDTAGITAAIQEAVQANPRLAAAAAELPVMSPNPGQGTSGGGAPTPKSTEQQIADLEKEGKWAEANKLKAQQLMDIRQSNRL